MKKDLKVNIDGTNYDVEVFVDDNLNISSVNVNGEVVDIESIGQISDSELNSSNISAEPIKPSKKTKPIATQKAVVNDISAPMAGTVLKVEKQIGDDVTEGDLLFVVESMKMEQMIISDYSGKIKEIEVKINDQISAGDILLKFENNQNSENDTILNSTENILNELELNLEIKSPMAGVILRLEKKAGEKVNKGELVVVMESMKMEQMVTSDVDGEIESVLVSINEQVLAGQVLVSIK